MTEVTNLPYNGNIPFSTATPFTYREGVTNLEMIHALKDWALRVVPDLNSVIGSFWEKYVEDYEAILDDIIQTKGEWQALFNQFMADVVAQLEGLNDQAMANLIRNAASETGTALAEAFDNHHRPEFFVDIAEFGALQDGSDATPAIVAANAYALVNKKVLVGSGTYTLKTPLLITAECDFSTATFNVDMEGRGITVTSVRRKHVFGEIINMRKTPGGWASVTNSVGLTVQNCNTSTIQYSFIRNFEHGLSVYGNNGGSAYNTFYCGALWHNKVNLVMESTTNTITGYSNQNTFIGGRYAHETNDGTPNMLGVKHVWFRGGISPDDGGRANNNLFLNSSFEGVMPEYTVDFDRASVNQMLNCRYEFGNAIIFREFARDNNLYGGFGLTEITKDVVNQGIRNRWTSATEDVTHAVFERKWANNNAHAFPWYEANWADRSIALGNGAAAPMRIRAITSASISVDGSFHPDLGDTYDMGTNTRRWRNILAGMLNVIDRMVVHPRTGHPTVTPGAASIYLLQNANGSHRLVAQLPDGTVHNLAGTAQ